MNTSQPKTPGTRPGQRLGPAERVRTRSDFGALFRGGRRGGDGVVRVIIAKNGLEQTRIAAAVQKRYGNAVRRNRLRRLYKEAFRHEKERLPQGYDVVCSPPRGTGYPALPELRASLVKVVAQTVARLEERQARQASSGASSPSGRVPQPGRGRGRKPSGGARG